MPEQESAAAATTPHLPLARSRVPDVSALTRERLLELLPQLWRRRLGIVVAPAGSGKTTLLSQFAAAAGVPVAYYSVERRDSRPVEFLGHLSASLGRAVPSLADGWGNVDEAAVALEQGLAGRSLLLLDDFHLLEGTAAEETLEQLLAYVPSRLAVLIASRSRPRFNWSRLLLSDTLLEIGADDLRFRSWEVERLFRDFYGEPLSPSDLADLARRTEGWAAGLKLFHLATRGRSAAQRRSLLASLSSRWSVAREYLARNVLEGLEPELRFFLVETCVLTSLSGRVCDELLVRRGSAPVLRELAERQLFTYKLDDGSYRYHETLRSQLEAMLVEELGERHGQLRFRRAGALLEEEGALPDALRAYCRAEAWDDVQRLLGRDGHRIVDGRPLWLDELPSAIVESDPWLLLAAARQQRAAGQFTAAVETYRRAELLVGGSVSAHVWRRERVQLAQWLEPSAPSSEDVFGLLRSATVHDPRLAHQKAARHGTPEGLAVSGLAALLAGDCGEAARLLARAIEELEPHSAIAAGAQLGLAVAHLLSGDGGGVGEATLAAEQAEVAGAFWLARLAYAALALADPVGGDGAAAGGRVTGEYEPNDWSVHIAQLFEGLGELRGGESPVTLLEDAVAGFRAVGAGVLEAWARGAVAVARVRAGDPDARETALQAEGVGRRTGVVATRAFAYLALAELDSAAKPDYRALAAALQEEHSLWGLAAPVNGRTATGVSSPSFELRCLGGLRLRLQGVDVDLGTVKPRARSLLRLLAMHEGRPVHREVLIEALWPECDPAAGARNLQVLISSLRQALEPGRGRGDDTLVQRDGNAYRLALPEGTEIDLTSFRAALATGRSSTDARFAASAFGRALDLYAELFPEEGPVEWIVAEREQLLYEAVEAATSLAEALLALDEPAGALHACRRGLALDRDDAALTRLRLKAYEAAGDRR
jgi:DNA-binding SARP family transcriptional activator